MPETLPCPTCGRPVLLAAADRPAEFPFCCGRCRDRDLGAWFTGRYTVAGEELTEVDRSARGVDRAERPAE
jgi:uncharacterized protein